MRHAGSIAQSALRSQQRQFATSAITLADIRRSLTPCTARVVLGRELQYYDEPAIEKIVEATRADGYRSRTLVKRVVTSYPFLNQHPSPELPD